MATDVTLNYANFAPVNVLSSVFYVSVWDRRLSNCYTHET